MDGWSLYEQAFSGLLDRRILRAEITRSHLPCGELRRSRSGLSSYPTFHCAILARKLVMAANKPVVVSGESLLLLAFAVLFVWAVCKLVLTLSR